MATSRSARRKWGAAIVATALAGAVAASLVSTASSTSRGRDAREAPQPAGHPIGGAFSWLRPTAVPSVWVSATIASGSATLRYPPTWRSIAGDAGTVTAALRDRSGVYHGYLNVTPREGAERLAGWASFRARRNLQEGDRNVQVLAMAEDLPFDRAKGSCVIDDYLSHVGSHAYRELACLVAGGRASSVLIGATPVRDWPALGPVIERAASALTER